MTPTRRDFLATSAALAGGGLLAVPGWAEGVAPLLTGPDPRVSGAAPAAFRVQEMRGVFTPIRRNTGFFTMRGGTIGYLINDDAVVVVDSQFPDQARVCIAGLDERSGGRMVDALVNTHHHGDHTGGNIVFRGRARRVVAHEMAARHMRNPPGRQPPGDQLFPDTTFTDAWSMDVGDERVHARYYGRAHTSGDAVITFERANVAHMGDLMFHRRQPVVDRAAGATVRGWMEVLDGALGDHAKDTVYIFGHAGAGLPVTGTHTDLVRYRDFLGAVLEAVGRGIESGRSRDEILAGREPLAGFEDFGPFREPGAREVRSVAYEELTEGA